MTLRVCAVMRTACHVFNTSADLSVTWGSCVDDGALSCSSTTSALHSRNKATMNTIATRSASKHGDQCYCRCWAVRHTSPTCSYMATVVVVHPAPGQHDLSLTAIIVHHPHSLQPSGPRCMHYAAALAGHPGHPHTSRKMTSCLGAMGSCWQAAVPALAGDTIASPPSRHLPRTAAVAPMQDLPAV